MNKRIGFIFALPLLLSVSSAALGAATDEEAERLGNLFQSYLGSEAGVVDVKADGDNYAATIDFAPLAKKAADSGVEFSITPIELTITDEGEGKWIVAQEGPAEYSIKSGEAFFADLKIEDYTWQGLFDEKLGTFESSQGEAKNIVLVEKIDDPKQGKMDVSASIDSFKVDQSGSASATGGADITAKYVLEGIAETATSSGNPAAGVPPFNFTLTAETGNYETGAKNLKSKPILDLIAFFISHQSKDLIVKDQADLKSALTAGLPLFDNLSSKATFNDVSVVTPVGPIAFDSIIVGVDANGFVKDGKFRESVAIFGIVPPPSVIPPWAVTLVPKNIAFDFQGSGFDLAAPAQLILAALDFSKDPPLPAGFENSLLPVFLPTGSANVALNPTSISNDVYSISAEGSMDAGPASMPKGKATVRAKGLDEIMKVIQAAPPEAGMQSGAGIVIAAKGMGKAEADGSITWNIESGGDGKVLINGIDLSQMK
jgi:hypothetical protein